MKWLLIAGVVVLVASGLLVWLVCVGASRADERYEQMLREQWRRHQ